MVVRQRKSVVDDRRQSLFIGKIGDMKTEDEIKLLMVRQLLKKKRMSFFQRWFGVHDFLNSEIYRAAFIELVGSFVFIHLGNQPFFDIEKIIRSKFCIFNRIEREI